LYRLTAAVTACGGKRRVDELHRKLISAAAQSLSAQRTHDIRTLTALKMQDMKMHDMKMRDQI